MTKLLYEEMKEGVRRCKALAIIVTVPSPSWTTFLLFVCRPGGEEWTGWPHSYPGGLLEGARRGCEKLHGGGLPLGTLAVIWVLWEVHEDCRQPYFEKLIGSPLISDNTVIVGLILKGTLTQDFGLLFFFFVKSKPLVPWFLLQYTFEYKFVFAEIFKFEGHSAYYQNTRNEIFLSC